MKIVYFLSVVMLAAAVPKKYTAVHPSMDLIEQAQIMDLSQGGRIVGGSNADISDYPWQVSLRYSNSHICGASIINSRWVVSAAHCTQNNPTGYSIRAGSTDRSSGGQVISVKRVINHPNYGQGQGTFANDISLLELNEELTMGNNVQAIDIATSSSEPEEGSTCYLSGWGRTSGTSSLPRRLQDVSMSIISNSECQNAMSSVGGATIVSSHICISSNAVESACNGDSGGPMTCFRSDGTPFLAGATSWGVSGCPGTYPSVYTRVSSFQSWINTNAV